MNTPTQAPVTSERLKELLALATPGPLTNSDRDIIAANGLTIADTRIATPSSRRLPLIPEARANAALLALSPSLAEEVLALRSRVEKMDEVITWAKGVAAALETLHKGQGVPPENVQHMIDGLWKASYALKP